VEVVETRMWGVAVAVSDVVVDCWSLGHLQSLLVGWDMLAQLDL
jgi:hypothetical protein